MKNENKQRTRGRGRLYTAAGIVLAIAAVLSLFLPLKENGASVTNVSEPSSVIAICELATLRSYYHNVAEFEKQPDLIFKYGLARYGYKRMWMEYSGIVEFAVDASRIRISEPDTDGVVRVYVPEASVTNVTADKETLSDPLTETGWFTDITAEDRAEAFAAAQMTMREEAEKDTLLLERARENAKTLLEQYILNTGREMGTDYSVRWVDKDE